MEASTDVYFLAITGIIIALSLSSVLYLVSSKFKQIPYTVLLFLLGIGLSSVTFEPFEQIRLTPGMVFFIFLPVLLFESAFNFDFRDFRRVFTPSFLFATVGLLISAFIVSLGMVLIIGIPFWDAFLYGCIISSTDPIAVLTLFKKLGVNKRLQFLVDGESYLNDATSVIMYKILVGFIIAGDQVASSSNLVILGGLLEFCMVLVGSLAFGAILGFVISKLISFIKNVSSVEILLTILAAHVVFIASENIFKAHLSFGGIALNLELSGILAILSCGLVMGTYGKTKISPKVMHNMHTMWDFLVFVSTSLIFFLIGLEVNLVSIWNNIVNILLITFLLLIGRAFSVYIVGGTYNLFLPQKRWIPFSWMHIVNWGALRGSLPLVVVLLLPEEYLYRELFLELVIGAIIFTLIFNSLTIEYLVKFLNLNKLTDFNMMEMKITEALLYKRILGYLDQLLILNEITNKTYNITKKKVSNKLAETKAHICQYAEDEKVKLNFYKVLLKFCINLEKSTYKNLFEKNVIDEKVYNKLEYSLSVQSECIDENMNDYTEIKQLRSTCSRKDLMFSGSKALQNKIYVYFYKLFPQFKDENRELSLKAQYFKARLIGNETVLEELDRFNIDKIVPQEVYKLVRKSYKDLESHNKNELKNLQLQNKNILNIVEDLLVRAEIENIKEELFHDFSEGSRVSQKSLNEFKFSL